jgi:hypothetical protein
MKTFYIFLLFVCIASLADSAFAQQVTKKPLPTLEQKIKAQDDDIREGQYYTFNLENDALGGGSDENYTSGVRLSYHDTDLTLPMWANRLGELYPGFDLNDTTALTFSVGQNLYTPRDISRSIPDPDDRPYAGWLYGSAALSTITNNHREQIEVAIGVVGPAALGKITQNFVHNHITTDADDPQGWDSQLKNEPGLMVSWSREYPEFWEANWDDFIHLSFMPNLGITLGNVYTLAQAGIGFRLSPYQDRYADLPTRVRPSIPGTGYFPKMDQKWSWGFFGGVNGYAVGRNIFLDGNTFTDSPSVDKKTFVYDASIGFDTIYSNTRLSYTLTRRSKEFDNQDEASIFGSLSLSRRF